MTSSDTTVQAEHSVGLEKGRISSERCCLNPLFKSTQCTSVYTSANCQSNYKVPLPTAPPSPDVDVGLQGKQEVGQQPLVHGRPFELWDAEHGGPRAGAELPPLLLRHGHAPEAQVHT